MAIIVCRHCRKSRAKHNRSAATSSGGCHYVRSKRKPDKCVKHLRSLAHEVPPARNELEKILYGENDDR